MRIPVGNEGLLYVRAQLERGHFFAKSLTSLDLTRGELLAFVPDRTDGLSLHLDEGGLATPDEAKRLGEEVGDFILDFLMQAPDSALAVFEEASGRRGDPAVESLSVPWFASDSYIHYYLTGEGISRDLVLTILRTARGFPTIGALLKTFDMQVEIQDRANMPRELVKDLAKYVHHILVGAFDQESYLVWSASYRWDQTSGAVRPVRGSI